MPNIKTASVSIKAAGAQDGTGDGVFEAIVATYDLDSYGDKIMPGAFADTLAEWKASGDPLPVLWSHQNSDPESHIGVVLDAEERPEGLWVKAQIDPEDLADKTSKAARIYRLLKGRRVKQFSFQFDVVEGGWVEKREGGVDQSYYELRKLKLHEVGPCLLGVNQQTDLISIKADQRTKTSGAPSPQRVAAPVEQSSLEDALLRISEELAEIKGRLPEPNTHDGKATPTQPADSAPAPPQAQEKSVPARPGTASLRLRADLALLDAEVSALTD